MQFPARQVVLNLGEPPMRLDPDAVEFEFHLDDRTPGGAFLQGLAERLENIGYHCRIVPVSGINAFQVHRTRSAVGSGVVFAYNGMGKDWLEHLVALLEAARALNRERTLTVQEYDAAGI